jgi:hypothetical protein
MDPKRSKKLKRIVSGMLSLAMITSMLAVLPANAEEESSQEACTNAVKVDRSKTLANRRV